MSSSGRTLLSVLADRTTTPFSIALGLGFTASSYFTFANVGLNFFGPVRMIVNDKKRKEIGLDTNIGKCIEIWANFYESATVSTNRIAHSLPECIALLHEFALNPDYHVLSPADDIYSPSLLEIHHSPTWLDQLL